MPVLVTDTLPDNTGYVAAAYLVFLALVLIYVAIMAAKLPGALRARAAGAATSCAASAAARARARGGRAEPMSELLALGISHKTAPVALRERLALIRRRRPSASCASSSRRDEVREAVAISTCNRTEIYLVVCDPVEAETELLGRSRTRADIRPTELADVVVLAAQLRRRAPALPRRPPAWSR